MLSNPKPLQRRRIETAQFLDVSLWQVDNSIGHSLSSIRDHDP